ncbi:MAG: rhodanese-like domain-containing protein [Pseudolabrys sp.]|jgi:rhodanese-related sulfurtransferase
MKTISPERAAELVKAGATLIDIREGGEYSGENIPGARHHALSQIGPQSALRAGDTVLIFHCKSGGRTTMNAGRLTAAAGTCETYVMGGGIEAWKRAGFATSARPAREPGSNAGQGGFLNRLSALFRG